MGEKDGWVFVPRYVNITGEAMEMPPVSAYEVPTLVSGSLGELVIVLSWEDVTVDLDGIITYPESSNTRNYIGYIGDSDITTSFTQAGTRALSSDVPITRPRDVTTPTSTPVSTPADIPRVETIRIPWSDSAFYVKDVIADTITEQDGVANNELRYYVNCWTPTRSLTGIDSDSTDKAFSNAQVDVV
ncbi:MAG: hypothetical protein PF447_04240, partial [Spirochaetaceae bacterium]|nr:hypothetical protein [Spirochaetaceae bacterium]